MAFDLDTYLAKIELEAAPQQTKAGLFQLQKAQFFKIPFENLDIQMGKTIELTPTRLMEKLVHQNRGGYCFELNGLMLLALKQLGFQARPLLARVHGEGMPSGKTHQITEVHCQGQTWILDAGFGAGGPRIPLELQAEVEARIDSFAYRFTQDDCWGWVLESWVDDQWKPSYSFHRTDVTANDIALGNFYTSHSPDTHFTQVRTVSLPTRTGRVSLRNFTLTQVDHGKKTRQIIAPGQAYLDTLKDHFGIDLNHPYAALKPVQQE